MKKGKKVLEYALLRCWDSDDQEKLHRLKWDSIIANGMLVLEECADETTIRKVVKDSLTAKFPLLGVHDFEYRVTMLLKLKLCCLLNMELLTFLMYSGSL